MLVDIDEKKSLVNKFIYYQVINHKRKQKKTKNPEMQLNTYLNDLNDLHVLERRMHIWTKNAYLNE